MITDNDTSSELQAQVVSSLASRQPLQIVGGGTKAFYGNKSTGTVLHTTAHSGVVAYEPSELFVTARSGTSLQALEALLTSHGQMLAFEPPCFGPESTIGGAVAAGLSGPGRPWRGAVRDHVLGLRMINGQGELASFGGQVMKNVAGYDISRLLAGSLGTLGVILELSLKVLPRPADEVTLTLEMNDREAFERVTTLRATPLPLTATCHHDGCLYLRLSGDPTSVQAARQKLGGEPLSSPEQFWLALRNQTHEFFQQYDRPLWRLSFPPATPVVSKLEGHSLVEWGGAQRWVYTNIPVNLIRGIAERSQGHATLYRGRLPGVNTFQPLPPAMLRVQQRLKQELDPHGIFNPGRLYEDW